MAQQPDSGDAKRERREERRRERREEQRKKRVEIRESWDLVVQKLVGRPRALKPTRARVADAFDDETADRFGLKYLEIVLERWREISASRRRTATLMVILGVSFVLLGSAKKAEFTLGPLKLTNVASVLTIVPAIVSFLFYELIALIAAAQTHRHVVLALVERLYPSVAANDLGRLLAPATPPLWGHDQWPVIREFAPATPALALAVLTIPLAVAVVVAPVAFLAYAFVHLYGNVHASVFAVSCGLAFAFFNVLRTLLVFVDAKRSEDEMQAGR